jgi:glycosyltransferase involved in cell wall biosynthesis
VLGVDVDLYGVERWLMAGATFAREKTRWRAKYRMLGRGFRARSKKAARYIEQHRQGVDLILQVGATFAPAHRGRTPYVLYCDANFRMAEHEIASGTSWAAPLTEEERRLVVEQEAEVYRGAAAIFTISERLRRSFIEDFGIEPTRVRAVYAAPNLDLSRIPPPAEQRPEGQPPTILFVGREFKRKGGDLLVEAFRRVRAHIPDARLIMLGVKDAVIQEPGIRFLGNLDLEQPDEWQLYSDAYRSADVFCLPTRYDPFPTVIMEAMYFGLPCIGTQTSGVPEMVIEDETGYTVPVNDCDALVDRLLHLLGDRSLARKMGEAGRARAVAAFSWKATYERMMEVIEPIVERTSKVDRRSA